MSGKSDIGPFAIVPRWVREACTDKPIALLLYASLADHADRSDNSWVMGRQQLAEEIRVGEKTIDRMVKHLESIGALEVIRQRRGPENVWSRYVIHVTMQGLARREVGSVETPGGDTGVALPIEPPTKTKTHQCDETFTEFWAGYPRKVGKPAASRAWKKVKSEEILAVMLGLSLAVKFWKDRKTEVQFIPHPATWLNDRRWEDDLIGSMADTVKGGPGPGYHWSERRQIWIADGMG